MTEHALLLLSSTELAALFGEDAQAHQRYLMLVALVREGRPVGEVARAFGVSRESLRRLRRILAQGDLAALRSRRGGGHFARGSPLARAIRDELASDPGASNLQLWQRVSQRLEEQNLRVPRSTFYRLVGRLRSGQDATGRAGQTATRLLREALGNLLEDPPLALGRGQLAALLLAEEREPAQRGQRLAQALHAAIEQLQPAENQPPDDPRWRWYQILAGEYIEGMDRRSLQDRLALSASTYSRAKRDGLLRLQSLLPGLLDQQASMMPPMPPANQPDLEALAEATADLLHLLPDTLDLQLTPEQHIAILKILAPVLTRIQQLREPYGE